MALTVDYVPLRDLQRHPKNPKDHDLGAIAKSVNRFGFTAPVILDERTGLLAAGHGRLDTLAQLKAQGRQPPANVQVKDGEWLIPVIRGVAFNSDAELDAFLVADNRLTMLGGWHEPELAALLQEIAAHDADLLDATGYDADDLQTLLDDLTTTDLDLGVDKDAKPNPRQFRIDGIFTAGAGRASAAGQPGRTQVFCCLAVKAGFLYGVQSSANACATSFQHEDHRPQFIDNDYFHYDHALHLEQVKFWKPRYATVMDVMTKTQCQQDGVTWHPLEQILEWAEELAAYAEHVIVIPKYDCLDQIPAKFMLGYSIPTSHGGTPLPPAAFKGRRVHLLGGSWKAQLAYMAALGDDVVSFDHNYVMKIAQYAQFVYPDGRLGSLGEDLGLHVVNPFFTALAISFGNMGMMVNELYPGSAVPDPEFAPLTEPADGIVIPPGSAVRLATPDDIDAIKRVAARYTKEIGFVMRPALEAAVAKGWVLYHPSGAFCNARLRKDGVTVIYEICVPEEARGQGIARAMIDCLPRPISLKCPEDNASNAFYAHLGFTKTGTADGKKRRLNIWTLGDAPEDTADA